MAHCTTVVFVVLVDAGAVATGGAGASSEMRSRQRLRPDARGCRQTRAEQRSSINDDHWSPLIADHWSARLFAGTRWPGWWGGGLCWCLWCWWMLVVRDGGSFFFARPRSAQAARALLLAPEAAQAMYMSAHSPTRMSPNMRCPNTCLPPCRCALTCPPPCAEQAVPGQPRTP